jgi:hypothetical protein
MPGQSMDSRIKWPLEALCVCATGLTMLLASGCVSVQPTALPTQSPSPTALPAQVDEAQVAVDTSPTLAVAASPVGTLEPVRLPSGECRLPAADWVQPRLDLDPGGDLRAALGCPVDATRDVFLAYQLYRRGRMVWREDTRQIYVLLTEGTWSVYPDTWDETQPEAGYYSPPPNLIEPKRGFGKVWRDQLGGPDAAISWAAAEELGVQGRWQTFEQGEAIDLDRLGVLILLADHSWR